MKKFSKVRISGRRFNKRNNKQTMKSTLRRLVQLKLDAFKDNKRKPNRKEKERIKINTTRTYGRKTKIKQPNNRPPWITEITQQNFGIVKLHHEIYDFYQYILPKDEENMRRKDTIKEIRQIIENRWPCWKVKVFGSFPNNLHLPDSDIDLVVFKDENLNFSLTEFTKYSLLSETEQLKLIYNELIKNKFAESIRYIDARVPIIKAVCKKTKISVDIAYYIFLILV